MDELSATIVNPAQSFSISNPHANEDWNSQIIEGQRLVSDASDEITIFQNPMFQRDLSHMESALMSSCPSTPTIGWLL